MGKPIGEASQHDLFPNFSRRADICGASLEDFISFFLAYAVRALQDTRQYVLERSFFKTGS
jgi:hypothetical protein